MDTIIHLTETESTNQYLSNLLRKEKLIEGSIVITNTQTAGKGQIGNSWESESGKNLTFSMVLYPDFIEAHEQFIISQLISVAIIDTLSTKIENVTIKWPNDIYVKDKKIAGILIENVLTGKHIDSCIIGIGLNVNQEIFLSNAPNPISLKNLTNNSSDLNVLLKEIRSHIFSRYMQLMQEKGASITSEYLSKLYRKDGFFPYEEKGIIFEARIKNVLSSGKIVLETKQGDEKTAGFKEIEFIF